MLSEPEKKLGSAGKRKGRDQGEAQSVAETKRARAEIEATAQGKDNRLLAGFLAHEFLSAGTLLGRRWDPSKGAFEQGILPPASGAYSQASYLLLKAEGTHIPGVVNPSQLARWLQM
ncbi:uncharacterized protein LOC121977424 [Zingiber officinale]|uniref:Uncharacterized protein n=1 Tax=Zingiber officinale TaxID=94328 RepID=A0A8J5LDJ6_ZINOF|nr:uncharacterized protein LOC121977424 [Zingiber officinale]KAG6509982.1 hypothetical protein ZIOFF_027990 [Zingiber officinale]